MVLLSLVVASGISFAVMRARLPSALDELLKFVQGKRFWVPLCVVFLVAYVLLLVCSTTYVGYLGHIEPHVASVSFVLLKGAPLYHDLASAQRYSVLYGPMAYLPYTLALRAMGPNVLSLKLVVFFANVCLLGLLWHCYRQLTDPPEALLLLVAVLGYLLISSDYVFQVRGDILIILSVALGLFAVLGRSAWISALLLALACALSFDIKFTALLYFLPLYILFLRRHGWRPAAWASIGAAVFALAPFFFRGISALGYLEWLRRASRHPLTRVEVSREAKVMLVVIAPLGLLLWNLARRSRTLLAIYWEKNRLFLVVLGSCVAAMAVPSSTIGAGPHHFLPFYPIVGYVCAEVHREIENAAVAESIAPRVSFIALLWFWLATAVAVQVGAGLSPVVSTLLTSRWQAAAVASDLAAVMKNHPGKKIEMGYGVWNSSYQLTYSRPALVFAGNPLTIDAVALNDMQLCGIGIPRSTLEYLGECKTQIWLIPKGDPPFDMLNVFSLIDPRTFPERPLFGGDFRRVFFERYRKQGSSQYFDIWECKTDSAPPAPSR